MTQTTTTNWGNVFTDEKDAVEAFKKLRIKKGIACKKCGNTKHYWLSGKSQFQCNCCKFRTTLRSGTVLEGSKLPISYFFIAWSLLIKNNNRVTIDEFQKETKHKYYEPLWEYLHKVKGHFKSEDLTKMQVEFIELTNPFITMNN